MEDPGSLLSAAWLVAWLLWLSNFHSQLGLRCLSILNTQSLFPDTWGDEVSPIYPLSSVHQTGRDSGARLVLLSLSLPEAKCSQCRFVLIL